MPKRILAWIPLAALLPACGGGGGGGAGPALNLEWGSEEAVVIDGYSGHAMEPKVFADEQILFFNDKPADDALMDIHYATRTGPARYAYQGTLTGANVTDALDGVPAIDADFTFYFVSLRTYASDSITVYGGLFDVGGSVSGVQAVGQDITETGAGKLIMDVDVSADGLFLILSRAVFTGGAVPSASDLDLAYKSPDGFVPVPGAAALFGKVNTPDCLEYAGTLSADGLELYFTRAVDPARADGLKILVSKRADASENFGDPAEIAAIAGEVTEGPCLSADGRFLYYHKRVGGVFTIHRVAR